MGQGSPLVEEYVKTCLRLWVAMAKARPIRQKKQGAPHEGLPAIRDLDTEGGGQSGG